MLLHRHTLAHKNTLIHSLRSKPLPLILLNKRTSPSGHTWEAAGLRTCQQPNLCSCREQEKSFRHTLQQPTPNTHTEVNGNVYKVTSGPSHTRSHKEILKKCTHSWPNHWMLLKTLGFFNTSLFYCLKAGAQRLKDELITKEWKAVTTGV